MALVVASQRTERTFVFEQVDIPLAQGLLGKGHRPQRIGRFELDFPSTSFPIVDQDHSIEVVGLKMTSWLHDEPSEAGSDSAGQDQ
jgi:hypothetical protein